MRMDVKYILFMATLWVGVFISCTSNEEESKLPHLARDLTCPNFLSVGMKGFL